MSQEFTMVARLRASPRHGGAMKSFGGDEILPVLVTDPPRGRPFGGGGVHHNGEWRDMNPHFECMMVARLRTSPRHGGAMRLTG